MADERTAVLVVGAGPTGCAAALFLALRGVDVLLVERHQSTSIQPRVTGQSPRTMELLRYAGVAEPALAAGAGAGARARARAAQGETHQGGTEKGETQQGQTAHSETQSSTEQDQTQQGRTGQRDTAQSQTRQSQTQQSQRSQTQQSQTQQSQTEQDPTEQGRTHQDQTAQSDTRQSRTHQSRAHQSQTQQGRTQRREADPRSPARAGTASLDTLEPVLLERAGQAGAQVRFATEVVDLTQDATGVTARLLNRWNERLTTVHASYVIAADGQRSPIRARLGIHRHGPGALGHRVCVVFDADRLGPGPKVTSFEYRPGHGESILDFTTEMVADLIRLGHGDPELDVRVHSVRAWEVGAAVADRFADGRVFLAGDAARVTPPSGSLAVDAAVADAYDLAWKLADVLSGAAKPALLDSYDAERRQFAEQAMRAALANQDPPANQDAPATHDPLAHQDPPADQNPTADLHPLTDDDSLADQDPIALEFDFRCRSSAVLAADDDPAAPTGQPGCRAPHVPLLAGATELSTVDLFGGGWTLLTGEAGGAWHQAAERAAALLGVRLTARGLGPDLTDPTGGLPSAYGIGEVGASLVRPDGVVAWRTCDEPRDLAGTLVAVLRSLLGHPTGGVARSVA